MFGGMAGAIIFRSAAERRGRRAASMRDRVLVLQAPEWDANGQLKTWSAGLLATQLRLVNGQLNPQHPDPRGRDAALADRERPVSDFFDLHLDGHDLTRSPPTATRSNGPCRSDVVHLPPGGPRRGPRPRRAPGSYALHALPSDHGAGFISPELTSPRSNPSAAGRLHRCTPATSSSPSATSRELPLANRRRITFTMRGGFLIDGKPFDPERVDQVVTLNTVEEWEIVNDSPLVHPFHIHINPFQITHRNGTPVDEPSYQDTVSIPPLGGSVTLRTLFADFPGRSVYHCHIVPHSDLGMMAVFEVRAEDDAPAPPPLVCPV